MPQIKKSYDEIIVPLAKMTFSPDVPSNALGSNEYNDGENVETDVRGIRSVSGEQEILDSVPGTPTYITGGFRNQGQFYYIVACEGGQWWMNNGTDGWTNITPQNPAYDGTHYTQNINITEAWNGTVVIFNDTVNAPFFLPDGDIPAGMTMYTQGTAPGSILDITYVDPTKVMITLATAYASPQYGAGDKIVITGVNKFYNGTYTVASSTVDTITYYAAPGAAYPAGTIGTVSAAYTWNYDPNLKKVSAGFVRIYSTPNVGNILVAGNLTTTDLNDVVTDYPVSVAWSQAFGLNDAPLTWQPTILNVANQLEVPLRGEVLDAFPSNGQLFLSSYWDTVVFTPMNYSTTSAPILGVRLFNQGRGLLSANCWANTDDMVYGIDARDIWVFDGRTFRGLGNQRVKNWFFDQLDSRYADRVYMEVNTQKNQVEIFYPDHNAPPGGVPNKMLSYRYDLDCWNPPRDVNHATFACEAPIWDPNTNTFNLASRTVTYARGVEAAKIIQKDQGYTFVNGLAINSRFRRDNIKLIRDYSGKYLVHRILPEAVNLKSTGIPIDPAVDTALIGSIAVTLSGANSVGQAPLETTAETMSTDTDYPWVQINQNAHRVNTLKIENDATTPDTIWLVNAVTFQSTETEDDR